MASSTFLKTSVRNGKRPTIRPKKAPSAGSKPSERSHQISLYKWWCVHYRPLERLFIHAANEGHRTVIGGALLRRMGMQPGFPDVFIAVPRGPFHGLMIELKIAGNKTTPAQIDMLEQLALQKYDTAVCYGWEDAASRIEAYMALMESA